jgi:hypothetical protein
VSARKSGGRCRAAMEGPVRHTWGWGDRHTRKRRGTPPSRITLSPHSTTAKMNNRRQKQKVEMPLATWETLCSCPMYFNTETTVTHKPLSTTIHDTVTDWEGYTLRITTTITLSHPDSAIRAVERTQRAKGDTHKHIRLTVTWPQQQLQALGLAVVSHPQAPTSPVAHRHVPSRQQLHGAGVHAARSVRVSPGSGNDARRGAGEGAPLHVSATQGRATDQGGPTQGGE